MFVHRLSTYFCNQQKDEAFMVVLFGAIFFCKDADEDNKNKRKGAENIKINHDVFH